MNIQASGLLSLVSGLDGMENIQQSSMRDGVLTEQFASTLLEQLEMLQQGQGGFEWLGHHQGDLGQLQDFAGLLGKDLPGMLNQVDIDLEETMQALADVLENIEAINVDNESSTSQTLLAEKMGGSAETDKSIVMAPAGDELLMVADVRQQSPSLLVASQEQDAAKLVTVLANGLGDDLPESLQKNAKPLSDMAGKNSPVSVGGKDFGGQALAEIENTVADAMAEQENDFHGAQKEVLFNTEKKTAVGEMAEREGMEAGTEKSLPKITAELAMLNRTVVSDNKTEISSMTRHFAHPEWAKEFSEKVIWMHKQAVPSAELNLNPRHLGPISIRVDVNQDQASIAFTAQHAAVKEAIEASLPKLREMLGAQQLNLLDVNVSQQQSEQKQPQSFFQSSGDQQGQHGKEQVEEDEFANGHRDSVISVADEIEAGRAIASKGILSIFA